MKPLVEFDAAYYKDRYLTHSGDIRHKGRELSALEYYSNRIPSVYTRSRPKFGRLVSTHLEERGDVQLLKSLLQEHGVFAYRFFENSVRSRVYSILATHPPGSKHFKAIVSRAYSKQYRDISKVDLSWVTGQCVIQLVNNTFRNIISNSHVISRFESWYSMHIQPRTCLICSKKFRVFDLPDWIYFRSNGQVNCCFQCRIVATPKPDKLPALIHSFVSNCGFIPRADASPITYSFTSRFPRERWKIIMVDFASMGGIDHVKNKFGSWFIALAESGVLPEGTVASSRGIKCIAVDGHVCRSLDEQTIDNWLHEHKIAHEIEPTYPSHPILNPSGRRRADWRVGKFFIEYFGLVGNPKYDKKTDEKIALAYEAQLPLITLFPEDISRLDEVLSDLINNYCPDYQTQHNAK